MDNYEFIAMWLNRARAGKIVSALDYGCGDGKLVKLLHHEVLPIRWTGKRV